VLPIMAASLLHKGTTVITNVPEIQDVYCMIGILEYLGCRISFKDHRLVVDSRDLTPVRIPDLQVKQMRSSIMLLGPMLGRLGEAATCHPGGCSIGERPVDLHLYALRELGADIQVEGERIIATAAKLQSADIHFKYPSVGATENALMAAVATEGITRIYGAAREPEIMELCRFLTAMGADISGVGSSGLVIQGGRPLHDITFEVAGDRIVAGTYLGALLAVGGEVLLRDAPVHHLEQMIEKAREMGAVIEEQPNGLRAVMKNRPRPVEIHTAPHPGFPTDLQSVMLAVAAVADGASSIEENVFEGRFATAGELQKMGADILVDEKTAVIHGTSRLSGATVNATDLRGGAALVVAGLAAEGETVITGYGHIRRGYEDICRDLAGVGVDITKLLYTAASITG